MKTVANFYYSRKEDSLKAGDIISCDKFALGYYDCTRKDENLILAKDKVWVGTSGNKDVMWIEKIEYDEDGYHVVKTKKHTISTDAYDESRSSKLYKVVHTVLPGGRYDGCKEYYPDGFLVKAIEVNGNKVIQFYWCGAFTNTLPEGAEITIHDEI